MKKKIMELGGKIIKTASKIHPVLRTTGKVIEKVAPYAHHVKDILSVKKKKIERKRRSKRKIIPQKVNNISNKIKINKKMKKRLRTYKQKFKMQGSTKILKEVMAGAGTTAVAKGLLGGGLLSSLVGIGGSYLIGKWNGVIGSIVYLILPGESERGLGLFSAPRLYGEMPKVYEGIRGRYYSKTTGKIINF